MTSSTEYLPATERPLHIVIVGHVDHGKSTLIGRLLHDTNSLPAGKLEEIQHAAERQGVRWEYAHILDHFEEERENGITIDSAQMQFHHEGRHYVIIDAPGHREFLKNMMTGSSQAEAALLLVDIAQGVMDQTWRHAYILGLLGIKSVAVLVNKMDLVEYSAQAFAAMRDDIQHVLAACGVEASEIVPIAARLGENLVIRSKAMPWYEGPTVIEALSGFQRVRVAEAQLRVPIQDVYDIDGQGIAVGRVESGVLRAGQDLWIMPERERLPAPWTIRKFLQEGVREAPAGDCVGIQLPGIRLRRGQVLVDRGDVACSQSLRASLVWLGEQPGVVGEAVTWKGTTQEVIARIIRIAKRFDPAALAVVQTEANEICPSEVAEVELMLERSVVADTFGSIATTGRFTLERKGEPVAGGIVLAST